MDLQKILAQHSLWLQGSTKGQRADLSYADLSSAYLRGADLSNAKGIDYFKSYPLYKYSSYVLKQTNKEPIVRMGCYDRTLKEWEADFWNNDREFPNDGSLKSIKRLDCYTIMIKEYKDGV